MTTRDDETREYDAGWIKKELLAKAAARAPSESPERRDDAPHADRRFIAHELLTLCLRLCMEPADSHSPETDAVLERWRKAWEEAAGGMDYDKALALVPEYAALQSATAPLPDARAVALKCAEIAEQHARLCVKLGHHEKARSAATVREKLQVYAATLASPSPSSEAMLSVLRLLDEGAAQYRKVQSENEDKGLNTTADIFRVMANTQESCADALRLALRSASSR